MPAACTGPSGRRRGGRPGHRENRSDDRDRHEERSKSAAGGHAPCLLEMYRKRNPPATATPDAIGRKFGERASPSGCMPPGTRDGLKTGIPSEAGDLPGIGGDDTLATKELPDLRRARSVMSVEIAAGVVFVLAPLWFNTTFALLARTFDYPDILRRPTPEILERFHAGGPSLILLWWAFMLSGLLLIAGVVLLGQVLGFTGRRSAGGDDWGPRGSGADARPAALGLPGAGARARQRRPRARSRGAQRQRRGVSRAAPVPRCRGRRAPRVPLHRTLVRVDRHRRHPGRRDRDVARVAGRRDRRRTDRRVGRIPRSERSARVGASPAP